MYVQVAGVGRGELTRTAEEGLGLGRGSCNYTSQSLWSAAQPTPSDCTASARGGRGEEVGVEGQQVFVEN